MKYDNDNFDRPTPKDMERVVKIVSIIVSGVVMALALVLAMMKFPEAGEWTAMAFGAGVVATLTLLGAMK